MPIRLPASLVKAHIIRHVALKSLRCRCSRHRHRERLNKSILMPDPNSLHAQHFEFMQKLCANSCTTRTKKSELQTGFTTGRGNLKRIIYFYCHGKGGSDASNVNLGDTHLEMTDGLVSVSDFQLWSGQNPKLPTSPLIFINACQGGQMTTIFYQTLAAELLGQGAVGLVGAQIDLPAVFAMEYAQLVFSKFLARDQGRVRLGPLLREVTRRLWDDHNNPLGLVYSLYRGADCFVDWPALQGPSDRNA